MEFDQEYEELLSKAKSDPETVDFQELRLVYARSSHYSPYHTPAGDQSSWEQLIRQTDGQAALRAVDGRLDQNYLDVESHLLAAFVYGRMDETTKADYHRRFGGGLLESILNSGDGQTPETAYTVIIVAEEYAVLGYLGLELRSQALVEGEGHYFDEMHVHHRQTGKDSTLYFNIDIPHAWLDRQIDEDPGALLASLDVLSGHAGREVPTNRKWWQFWR
jgi:hypothetical protein